MPHAGWWANSWTHDEDELFDAFRVDHDAVASRLDHEPDEALAAFELDVGGIETPLPAQNPNGGLRDARVALGTTGAARIRDGYPALGAAELIDHSIRPRSQEDPAEEITFAQLAAVERFAIAAGIDRYVRWRPA